MNWIERLRLRRDGLIASPRFQRWAGDFPLTRWVARRRARALFDVCAGFVYSQVLLACVRLRVFEHLRAGPLGPEEAAAALGLAQDPAGRLLDAAVAIGLLRRTGKGDYALGPLGSALQGQPGLQAMIEHHALFYRDLADPVPLLKGEPNERALQQFWAYSGAPGQEDVPSDRAGRYTRLMAESQSLVAHQVLSAYSLRRHRRILDLGGGNGTFLTAAGRRAPHAELVLFDLPAVAALAETEFRRAGMHDRCEVVGGNFLTDPLPRGADLITLVRVLHDHDDAAVLGLLQRAKAVLAPGGRLLVAEPMAGTRGAEMVGDAYFGLYLLAMGQGKPRSRDELTRLLQEGGFSHVRPLRTSIPLQTSVLTAR